MKATQVITELKKLLAAHGDQDVVMENAYDSWEITNIRMESDSAYFILYSDCADPGRESTPDD